jgi:hypothetical protein
MKEFAFPSDQRTYHITVRGKGGEERIFETVRLLSDSSATYLYSHGTRVWEVFDIKDPLKERRVLKDTWVRARDMPEGDVVEEIRERLGDQPEKLEHLPSILMHGVVRFSDGSLDDIFRLSRRGVDWPKRERLPLVEGEDDGELSFFSATLPMKRKAVRDSWEDVSTYLMFAYPVRTPDVSRRHWRLVYADPPGIPFHDLKNYDQMLLALHGALQGW